MSIYSALSLKIPLITYSVVHQMRKGVEGKQYVKTVREMHSKVKAESDKVMEVWKNHLAEVSASSVQTTRATLSQFLTLPLDTDMKEVYRILEDQVGQLLQQTLPQSKLGVQTSIEGKYIWDREQSSVLQSMLARGKAYLRKLKFRPQEEGREIFESLFFVEGGLNLDIIEHIVRDRMGIYATAHGQHTRESDPFVFAVHNLAYLQGPLEAGEAKFEAVIHFSKGKPQYDPFRKELIEVLDSLHREFEFGYCSLWQRKLGLGAGTEFNIRVRAKERKSIKDFLLAIAKNDHRVLVHEPIAKNGNVLIKELLY